MYFGGSWALSMIGHEPLPLRSLTPSFMECFKGIPNGGRVVVRVKAKQRVHTCNYCRRCSECSLTIAKVV